MWCYSDPKRTPRLWWLVNTHNHLVHNTPSRLHTSLTYIRTPCCHCHHLIVTYCHCTPCLIYWYPLHHRKHCSTACSTTSTASIPLRASSSPPPLQPSTPHPFAGHHEPLYPLLPCAFPFSSQRDPPGPQPAMFSTQCRVDGATAHHGGWKVTGKMPWWCVLWVT